MGQRYLRIGIAAVSRDALERALAEAMEAGALGVEERDDGAVWLFAATSTAPAVLRSLAALAAGELRVGEPEALPDVAWSEAWKEGLAAVVVSPRLVVRPPFVARPEGHTGADLVIEPGQAFGTGAHATTFLALALLDGLGAEALLGARVLDVGCGSGVLALAALALGAAEAVACDLDPLATGATRAAGEANALARGLRVFRGTTDALRGEVRFDLVLANLIRRELLPVLPALAAHTRAGGHVVLSGLLEAEEAELRAALAGLGLAVVRRDARSEPAGGDRWLALALRRV
jgi:ribosomal protein L11 methyltransferase